MKERSTHAILLIFILCFIAGVLLGMFHSSGEGSRLAESLFPGASSFNRETPDSEVEVLGPDGKKHIVRLTATSYLAADLEKGTIFKEKAKDVKLPIASVTKLMTAVVALENTSEDELATVSKKALEAYGKEGGFVAGEKVRVGDLLYAMLLESSNDAAEILAEHLGRPAFLDLMNKKAEELGMTNTFFEDPSGLSPRNVSTAEDLFLLAEDIRAHYPEIIQKTKAQMHRVAKTSVVRAHTWYNHNKFVRTGDASFIGGKNGYIPESLQTGISFFDLPIKNSETNKAEKRPVVIVVLKSVDRYQDFSALASFVTGGIRVSRVPSREASLVFVGDMMLDRGVRAVVEKYEDGDYGSLFENAFFIQGATLAFGNVEGPLSDKGYDLGNTYSFRMEPEVLLAMKDAGFDALSVANNHIGDWGRDAFEDTLHRLDDVGILSVGAGYTKEEARKVKILEVNGLKIGFLGFSDVGPKWLSTNGNLPVIVLASDPDYEKIIQDAAAQVDHLVVSFHFGEEYETKANARQIDLAHRAIDAGAHIVIGHHPHVAQQVERYKEGVIAYSLGNFIFDQTFSEATKQGLVLQVGVSGGKIVEVNQAVAKQNDRLAPGLAEDSDI